MQPLGLLVYEGFRISDELLSELTQWNVHVRLLLGVSACVFVPGVRCKKLKQNQNSCGDCTKLKQKKHGVLPVSAVWSTSA